MKQHPFLRKTTSILFTLLALSSAFAAPPSHDALDQVLKKHVGNGQVDYAALKNDRQLLDDYIATIGGIGRTEFDTWNANDQLAFLINLYNAETLQLIIDNYPLSTIKDIGSIFTGPWDRKEVKLFGQQETLNFLEHDFIRENYDEPRIHYALVCAALSCPPLRSEAYLGNNLNEQLNDQAKVFLTDTTKNRIDTASKNLHLSKIFDWYGDDFRKNNNTLIGSLKPYLPENVRDQVDSSYQIKFVSYDWQLNDKGATLAELGK